MDPQIDEFESEFDYKSAEELLERVKALGEDEKIKVKAYFYLSDEEFKSNIEALHVEIDRLACFVDEQISEFDFYTDLNEQSITFPVGLNLGMAILQEQDLFKSLKVLD